MNNKLINNILNKDLFIRYRFFIILLFQVIAIGISYSTSYFIRFEFRIPSIYRSILLSTLPLLLICRLVSYYLFKLHLGSWRFASMQDLIATLQSVVLGSIIFVIMMVFSRGLEEFPRSVFILEMFFNMALIGGSRFLIRYYHEIKEGNKAKILKYVLMVGAGKAGVLLLNEIRNNPELGIRVAGIVDDNPYRKGIHIQGVFVLGSTKDIPDLVKKYNIDEVIIAIPSAKYKNISRIIEIVKSTTAEVKVLPGMGKLMQDGGFSGYLKDVAYDELLGRKTIKFCRDSDYKLMQHEIKDRVVLVTGAAGSIGSELCRQIIQFNPSLLIMYERYENSLYDLDLELKRKYPDKPILPIIGDILDTKKLGRILKEHEVSLIYHAAAYKHVPLMEREPLEAIRNNVFGTLNVSKLAIENNISKFVLISTDKAVNPANVMGTTKRIAELIIQGLNGNSTKFIAVRFGNVIGSNGSVIPLFKKQIEEGGPITVTHPDITRYFMSIPEAVQLVMTAGAMGNGGEIFLLDMGKPIRIADIAKELVKRSGLEPGEDIDIVCTGLRPGEKLHEELYWQGEGIVETGNKKITMLKPDNNKDAVFDKINKLDELTLSRDIREVIRYLKEIVPESTVKYQEFNIQKNISCKSSE